MSAALTRARVAREDLMMFINACFVCTGQHEFYGPSDRGVSNEFLHLYTLGNYRRLYARTLAAGINHFNVGEIIFHLLANPMRRAEGEARDPRSSRYRALAEEGELIFAALCSLPTQRALRTLEKLRQGRINNRRSRAIVRRYFATRADLPFLAVKYRRKVQGAAIHAHLKLPGEVGPFLFGKADEGTKVYATPIFAAFKAARYSKAALFQLPTTVAEGIAATREIPHEVTLARASAAMTVGEKFRAQQRMAGSPLSRDLDLGRVGLTRLAVFLLGRPRADRAAHRGRFQRALEDAARRVLRRSSVRLGRVAAVLDRSYSSSGSSEKSKRPLAVAWGTSLLLAAAATEYRAFWTGAPEDRFADELLLTPRGQSDLATPLLDALEWGAELVVIVSDGYENDPPNGAGEVVRVFRTQMDPLRKTTIVHLNPAFDTESMAPRSLGAWVPTLGIRDAEDLFTVLGFARFVDGGAALSDLESYLGRRAEALVGGTGSVAIDVEFQENEKIIQT